MAAGGNKTVRFAKVVERSGQPHVHTLWLQPEKDPELQRAQKAGRVMTVERNASGGKTDVGVIGFDPKTKNAQFLVFPKSLKAFDASRVIGIKFDLVEQPKVGPAQVRKSAHARSSKGHARSSARKSPTNLEAREKFVDAAPAGGGEKRANVSAAEAPDATSPLRAEVSHPRSVASSRMIRFPAGGRGGSVHGARKSKARPEPKKSSPSDATLIREIRAALKDLEAGKSVSAYQRLQRAIADRE